MGRVAVDAAARMGRVACDAAARMGRVAGMYWRSRSESPGDWTLLLLLALTSVLGLSTPCGAIVQICLEEGVNTARGRNGEHPSQFLL